MNQIAAVQFPSETKWSCHFYIGVVIVILTSVTKVTPILNCASKPILKDYRFLTVFLGENFDNVYAMQQHS